jgi:hypothetical protein
MTVEEYFEEWWTPKELPDYEFNKTAMLDFAEMYHKESLLIRDKNSSPLPEDYDDIISKKKMIKVFISSPYTLGDVALNVKRQIDVADELMNLNFLPFVPLYYHFQHMFHPRDYDQWLKFDLQWVESCDCLLRLDGESKGADIEVSRAKELKIPVFYSIDELKIFYS